MKIEKVKELAEILSQYDLTSVEISEGENKIKLEKTIHKNNSVIPKGKDSIIQNEPISVSETDNQAVNFNKLIEVKSPVVGIFYSAPAPDADPFVTIGSKIKKGDVLCIIEAMKLMNEITSEVDGEIVDICLKNGDIAEFGQVLFKIF